MIDPIIDKSWAQKQMRMDKLRAELLQLLKGTSHEIENPDPATRPRTESILPKIKGAHPVA